MHHVRCPALICVSNSAAVVDWSWRVRGLLFGDVQPPLRSLAVIKCSFGHGLVIGMGAVQAVRICGSSKGRWNPYKTGIRSQKAVWIAVDICYLQAVTEFDEHHCTVSMVSRDLPCFGT